MFLVDKFDLLQNTPSNRITKFIDSRIRMNISQINRPIQVLLSCEYHFRHGRRIRDGSWIHEWRSRNGCLLLGGAECDLSGGGSCSLGVPFTDEGATIFSVVDPFSGPFGFGWESLNDLWASFLSARS
jgi:hypothetical protein